MEVLIATAVLAVVTVFILRRILRSSKDLPLPPGPPRLPLLGNLHNATPDNPFIPWHAWSKRYGPVMSLSVPGQTIIILGDAKSAGDLLGRRASVYSGRPYSVMSTLITPGRAEPIHMLLRPYDATFRLQQRLLTACMNATSEARFHPAQDRESAQLVHDLLLEAADDDSAGAGGQAMTSDRLYAHLERAQASLVMDLSYGYRIPTPDHPTTRATLRVHGAMTDLVTQTHLVDVAPALRHLPAPLSPWRRAADRVRALETELHLRNFAAGLAAPGWNFAKKMRASDGARGTSDFDLAYLVGANTVAGIETAPRAAIWLFVAALTAGGGGGAFVTRAQEVLDAVVGRGRIPELADRPRLAYVEAVVLELLRWRPVAATGVPHKADGEDTYAGFRIPKGSIVIFNAWGIGRDESVFGENAEEFVPERWLTPLTKGGGSAADWTGATVRRDLPRPFFGYGRRMCTGRHLALDGLWLVTARLLWAFRIESAGEDTLPDPLDIRPHGFTITPGPFKLVLKPRGPWVKDVILCPDSR
ncbi:Fumitremorgin C synthase [Pleurostoma richardsiae]|uniref:Fumitremorgin C synthase n=1 Tax=Pleurostoma richardsiae TaxID=41990 RepID=A0AA38S113_9PEZI|nr:Fumitremorgin C synthase [Pleurostoma richardsiae]